MLQYIEQDKEIINSELRIRLLRNKLEDTKRQIHLIELASVQSKVGTKKLSPYKEEIKHLMKNETNISPKFLDRHIISTLVEMHMKKGYIKAPTKLNYKCGVDNLESYLAKNGLKFLLKLAPLVKKRSFSPDLSSIKPLKTISSAKNPNSFRPLLTPSKNSNNPEMSKLLDRSKSICK